MSRQRTEGMFIDGQWRAASDAGVVEVENPATRSVVATVPKATATDLADALAAAERAWPAWRATTGFERSALLRRAAVLLAERTEEIATLLTQEQGKPLAEARAEVRSAVEQFDWYADEARRIYGRSVDATSPGLRIEVRREPVGPVAAFTPWNFPVMLASRKLAPALAAGCPIILKPAEEAPSACLAMVRVLQDAGLPAGTVAAVTGDPAFISETLLASPIIRKVSLTGSVRVGRQLMILAAENMARISLELGGHGPVVVCDDVDIAAVARLCALTKFRNSGQVCISPTRFFVPRALEAAFTAEFVRVAESLSLGDGAEPGVDMGPMCSARRHDEFAALVQDAVESGAHVATGARSLGDDLGGYHYSPTVLTEVPPTARILHEEPFGPVALIVPYDDLPQAVRIANSTPYGLAAYAFTRDTDRARLLSEQLNAGMLGINTFLVSTAVAPFSGIGLSGMGAENGTEGMDQYLHPKSVVTGITGELQ